MQKIRPLNFRGRSRVDIIAHAEILERFLNHLVVTVDYILRCDAFFLSFDGDRHSVFVGTANKQYVFAFHAEVAHVGVGWHVHACQVSDVHWAIRIRQRRSYQITFEILFHFR